MRDELQLGFLVSSVLVDEISWLKELQERFGFTYGVYVFIVCLYTYMVVIYGVYVLGFIYTQRTMVCLCIFRLIKNYICIYGVYKPTNLTGGGKIVFCSETR